MVIAVFGEYKFCGKQNPQVGLFEMGSEYVFTGSLLDPNSKEPHYQTQGQIKFVDSEARLEFRKFLVPSVPNVPAIKYMLKKSGNEIVGKYVGQWVIEGYEEKLREGRKMLAYSKGRFTPSNEFWNEASLTLAKL